MTVAGTEPGRPRSAMRPNVPRRTVSAAGGDSPETGGDTADTDDSEPRAPAGVRVRAAARPPAMAIEPATATPLGIFMWVLLAVVRPRRRAPPRSGAAGVGATGSRGCCAQPALPVPP